METERQALVARLAEAEGQRAQALAEAARREEARKAQAEVQRQRAAELDSRIAAAMEREAKQTERWRAAQAELSARIARLEANEVMAERARTELVNRKKDSERALAALQNQKDALAKRLDAVEKARDQARATVAKYEAAHEELIASGAPLEKWRARFKRALPEAEGHDLEKHRAPEHARQGMGHCGDPGTVPTQAVARGAGLRGPGRRRRYRPHGRSGRDRGVQRSSRSGDDRRRSKPRRQGAESEAPPQTVRPSSIERTAARPARTEGQRSPQEGG